MTVTSKILLGILVIVLLYWFLKPSDKSLQKSAKIPNFSLQDQFGKLIESKSFLGKPLVVYFYPKDNTPGCTKEACSFRDNYELFQDKGVAVVGISADDVASHKDFAEKYQLPFTLLADPERTVHKAFGVGKELGTFTSRITFIIDKKGIIIKQFKDNINAEKHIQIALKALNIN